MEVVLDSQTHCCAAASHNTQYGIHHNHCLYFIITKFYWIKIKPALHAAGLQ